MWESTVSTNNSIALFCRLHLVLRVGKGRGNLFSEELEAKNYFMLARNDPQTCLLRFIAAKTDTETCQLQYLSCPYSEKQNFCSRQRTIETWGLEADFLWVLV